MGIKHVKVFRDLLLVMQQVATVFQCFDESLNSYLDKCLKIIALFDDFTVRDISRHENTVVNDLAQQASGFRSNLGKFSFLEKPDVLVYQIGQSSFQLMHNAIICSAEPSLAKSDGPVSETGWSGISRIMDESSKMMTSNPDDWRTLLVRYLENPGHIANRKVRRQASKYVMHDNTLYRRPIDGLLLKCLGLDQSKIAVGEVHEGICGTHQSAHKMKWLLRRAEFYWPTMLNNYFRYYKGCETCQKFEDVQLTPTTMLHPIIKPWSFHGWALDFVGQIHPASSKRHRFMLVAMDYFTKWMEIVPLKNMMHREVIHFTSEHIAHRFGIPQTLTTDQGMLFMSHQVREFAESLKIKLLNSSPYYAQANGHAESSNKTLIKLIKKKIEENPKMWQEVLSEVLWAHPTSKHSATKVTHFELVYEQEAVLPVEVSLDALQIARRNELLDLDYHNLMLDRLEEVSDERVKALCEIERELRVVRAYTKRVKEKSFQVGDLVWKTVLPIGSRSSKFGKWSPNWEGPYRIE
jgi:hypothetical protein